MTIGDLKKMLEGIYPIDGIQLYIEDEYGCSHPVDAAYLISIVTDPRDLKGLHFRTERGDSC